MYLNKNLIIWYIINKINLLLEDNFVTKRKQVVGLPAFFHFTTLISAAIAVINSIMYFRLLLEDITLSPPFAS